MSLGCVVQPIAGLLAPFHRLSGQGRTWVGFSWYSPPRAASLGALAFELALRDPGSEKRWVRCNYNLQPWQAGEHTLARGRSMVGTEVFWPAVPPPVASNHASDSELQRQIIAGRGLSGGYQGLGYHR